MSDEFEEDSNRPRRKRRPDDFDDDDDRDDERPRKRRKPSGGDGGVEYVIPYKNAMALTAYYCGVFGLISCFLFGVGGLFGIVPITLGIMGLRKAKEDPEAHGTAHAWVGIALGTLEVLTGCGTIAFIIAGVAGWIK